MAVDLDQLRWAVETLRWTKTRKQELKELEEKARDAIEEALGHDTEGILDGDVAVTWRYHKRTALDQQALKTTFPDIYEVCRRTTEVRRFEVEDHDGE